MNQQGKNQFSDHLTSRPAILLGSESFMNELEVTSKSAKDRFFVQVMTFEGDTAGKRLIDLMITSPAQTKVLVVDHYSDVVLNDTLVHFPPGLIDKNLQKEYSDTRTLLDFASDHGIRLYRTNPIGTFYHRYPLRNHKKSIVIDNTLFTGGINFSEHNFSWHDMMVRIESNELASIVANDITANALGKTTSGVFQTKDTTLMLLNRTSEREYVELFNWIRGAKSTVTVFSPYVSDPLLSVLKSISDKIKVLIIVPGVNNKSLFTDYLRRESLTGWFQYIETPGLMSHLKAILLDDQELIFGSTNFDFISYLFEEEIVLKTTDPHIVEAFIQQVYMPMMAQSHQALTPSFDLIKSYIPVILWNLLKITDPKSHLVYNRT